MSAAWKITDANIAAKCLKLTEEGISADLVAQRLGLTRSTVHRHVVVARRDRDLAQKYSEGRKDER